ncbi:MAG TPA: 6,7-dimethyl-8-ribityllumazine synthase [Bacteroidia bacterium]|nr:6,7-dimethyl-8-ribityllumazine synthase [Bacteroidia bacterium]
MSSKLKNLSEYNPDQIPSAGGMKFGIVVADWNQEVTSSLLKGALETLISHDCDQNNIQISRVPGSYELTLGAQWLAEKNAFDAVICLGCVIQGETRHFDFICQAVSTGLTDLSIKFSIPFIFGVLTPENQEQALDRSGGKHGNKGVEAAITAIKMVALRNEK